MNLLKISNCDLIIPTQKYTVLTSSIQLHELTREENLTNVVHFAILYCVTKRIFVSKTCFSNKEEVQ